jgi:hypothetical protein
VLVFKNISIFYFSNYKNEVTTHNYKIVPLSKVR